MTRRQRLAATTLIGWVLLLVSAGPALTLSPPPSPSPDPSSPSASSTPAPSATLLPCPTPAPIASPAASPGQSAQPDPSVVASGAAASPVPCLPQEPRLGLGVGPSQVILGLDERTGSFTVYNAGTLEETIVLSYNEVVVPDDGIEVALYGPPVPAAAPWLLIDPVSFTLQPETSQLVQFQVSLPDGSAPGDHVAGIQVLASVSDETWARVAGPAPSAGQVSIRSQAAFTVTVIARVAGVVVPRVEVGPFDPFLPWLVTTNDGTFVFTPTIVNDGNVAAVWMPIAGPTASLDTMVPTLRLVSSASMFASDDLLYDGSTAPDGSVSLSPLVVLPGASHTQKLELADAPLFGSYDYTYTLPASVADGRSAITASGHFMIVNLQKVLLWIVLPLLLLLMAVVILWFRRRGRRISSQAHLRELAAVHLAALAQGRDEALRAHAGRP